MSGWRQSGLSRDEASPTGAADCRLPGLWPLTGTRHSAGHLTSLLLLPAENSRARLHQPCFTEEVMEAWGRLHNWLKNRVCAAGSSPGLLPLSPAQSGWNYPHTLDTLQFAVAERPAPDPLIFRTRGIRVPSSGRPLKYKVFTSPSVFQHELNVLILIQNYTILNNSCSQDIKTTHPSFPAQVMG